MLLFQLLLVIVSKWLRTQFHKFMSKIFFFTTIAPSASSLLFDSCGQCWGERRASTCFLNSIYHPHFRHDNRLIAFRNLAQGFRFPCPCNRREVVTRRYVTPLPNNALLYRNCVLHQLHCSYLHKKKLRPLQACLGNTDSIS